MTKKDKSSSSPDAIDSFFDMLEGGVDKVDRITRPVTPPDEVIDIIDGESLTFLLDTSLHWHIARDLGATLCDEDVAVKKRVKSLPPGVVGICSECVMRGVRR